MEMRLTPLKRGLLELNELAVGIPDPLGLTFSLRLVKKPQKLLVLPKSYAMPDYEFPGAARSQAGSLARGLIGGTEDDFINLRDYRPGDALKQIHWFSSAKPEIDSP
ncbi:MAG: DUF58 domain-containing protein [Verrucomicrobia bacterium]|nr:DUF58 domain-containing protein [Verrucomicrobiota bacterium]